MAKPAGTGVCDQREKVGRYAGAQKLVKREEKQRKRPTQRPKLERRGRKSFCSKKGNVPTNGKPDVGMVEQGVTGGSGWNQGKKREVTYPRVRGD